MLPNSFHPVPLLLIHVSLLLCQDSNYAPQALDVFSFDYTWNPSRPVANDTVAFQAITDRHLPGWNITEESFRWYQQLPSSGYQLRHIGRRFLRNASETYFEGRYRLRIMSQKQHQQRKPNQFLDGDLMVDVEKYVGVQKQIDIEFITNATESSNSSDKVLVCRFWGWPLVYTLQFQPGSGSTCERQHFVAAEAEPHVDLVISCSKLLPGTFSCYGRNSVSASQLSCDLSGPDFIYANCYRPSLGEAEVAAVRYASIPPTEAGDVSLWKKTRQSVKTKESNIAANIHQLGLFHVNVAMATLGLVFKYF